jgi:phosphoribosyl-ATP pyrophosphohydrolase/phosphoribosyl-AMP cyclohydrolase
MTLPVPDWIDDVSWTSDGLAPCVVQSFATGAVLMVAWMNRESLHRTIETGQTWFWSRSRKQLWPKGATSGNTQTVRSLHLDCDRDTLLAIVDQHGTGACHTGASTCFVSNDEPIAPGPILAELLGVVMQRDRERPAGSYTTQLLEGGVDRAGKKVGEEATEVVIAAKNAVFGQGTAELAEESADLLYHLFVLWRTAGLDVEDVAAALARRRG